MSQFLYKVCSFLGILLIYFLCNYGINQYNIANTTLPLEQESILIAGDSHTQKALDPVLFHSANNISQPAEPLFLTFIKLQYLLDRLNPDTVILGFAPQNISTFNDRKLIDDRWAMEMYRRYAPLNRELLGLSPIEMSKTRLLRTIVQEQCLYPQKQHLDFLGGFANVDRINTIDPEPLRQTHFVVDEQEAVVSKVCLSYLDSITSLAQAKQLTLILVSTPIQTGYRNVIPKAIDEAYQEKVVELRSEGLMVVNFDEANYPDSLFLDPDHLNLSGTRKFYEEFQQVIQSN